MRKIRSGSRIAIHLVVASSFVCATAPAVGFIYNRGQWPASWPEGLDRFRDRAETAEFSSLDHVTCYGIPFHHRRVFESAWEDLLQVRSEGSPITLVSAPTQYAGLEIKEGAAVLIPAPDTNWFSVNGTRYKMDDVIAGLRASGIETLPQRAVFDGEKWVPWQEGSETRGIRRQVRTELILVVDGDVIDPSRLAFPDDAEIVDKRQEETTDEGAKEQ